MRPAAKSSFRWMGRPRLARSRQPYFSRLRRDFASRPARKIDKRGIPLDFQNDTRLHSGMFPTLKTAKYAFNAGRYFLTVPLQLRNRALRRSGVAGPLPLPPPRLSFLVQWVYDLECHYESGKLGYACIVDSLERNGYSPRSFKRILEFGCGCGRLLRHWEKQDGQSLHGVDYNADMSLGSPHLSSVAKFETAYIPPLRLPKGFRFRLCQFVFHHFDDSQQGPGVTGALLRAQTE